MQKVNSFVLSLLCCFITLVWYSCSRESSESPVAPTDANQLENSVKLAKNRTVERNMPELARKIALRFRNSQMRSVLLNETARAEGKEHILMLDELLQADTPLGRFEEVLSLESTLVDAITNHAAGIDVYFPVEKHRTSILQNPQQDFLVSYYDGTLDDKQDQQFIAWDKNGNKIMLSTAKVPTQPVLILTQCEHKRDHTPLACEGDCGGGGGGSGPKLVMDKIIIYDDNEGWPNGAPEIKINVYKDTNQNNANQSNKDRQVDLHWVNDENVWYNQNATVWYWNDGDTNGRVLIRVFEEDWPTPDDHMAWFWPLWQVGNQQELFEVNEVRLFVFTD